LAASSTSRKRRRGITLGHQKQRQARLNVRPMLAGELVVFFRFRQLAALQVQLGQSQVCRADARLAGRIQEAGSSHSGSN
jgi:hypothetical protein